MVIRATQDILKGEEVTMPYIHGATYFERMMDMRCFDITCSCLLCAIDKKDGEVQCKKRSHLLNEFLDKPRPRSEEDVEPFRSYIKDLEATYGDKNNMVRPLMEEAYRNFGVKARRFLSKGQNTSPGHTLGEEVHLGFQGLEAVGIEVVDKTVIGPTFDSLGYPIKIERLPIQMRHCSSLCISLAAHFNSIGDHTRTKKWLRAALWSTFKLFHSASSRYCPC
jgi:hypothetical protein